MKEEYGCIGPVGWANSIILGSDGGAIELFCECGKIAQVHAISEHAFKGWCHQCLENKKEGVGNSGDSHTGGPYTPETTQDGPR